MRTLKRFINTRAGKIIRFPLILAIWLLMPIVITVCWWILFWCQFGIIAIVTEDW